MQQQEDATRGDYEARHRFCTCRFASVEEYQYLLDAIDEGEWALECWRLGGDLVPPVNPYEEPH